MKVLHKEASEVIGKAAEELKNVKEIAAPEWGKFCKTGVHKERPPVENDWWHTRAAAVLRTVSIRGPIGVSKLRTKYGGRKNRGMKPEHHFRGSGSIIRKVLQQLEAANLIKKEDKGVHKGRVITQAGKQLLEK